MLGRGYRRVQQFLLPLTGGISATSVEAILSGANKLTVQLADWDRDPGAGSMWDLLVTCLIARHRTPSVCFEIGTGHGRSTHHLSLNTPPGTQIFSLDISTEPFTGGIFRDQSTAGKISRIAGDSRSFDFRPWMGRVDFVLVDGDHSYDAVCADTEHALAMLAPGGCILWDDFTPTWPGVVRALKHHPLRTEFRRISGTKMVYYSNR